VRSGPGRISLLFAASASPPGAGLQSEGTTSIGTRIEQESQRTCRLVRNSRRIFPS
jgi:hypothetical protein